MCSGPRAYAQASCNISEAAFLQDNHLREISALYVPPESRRQGLARWLLCEICVEADRESTVLVLSPEIDKEIDLIEFYSEFGFRIVQQKPVLLMAREPKCG